MAAGQVSSKRYEPALTWTQKAAMKPSLTLGKQLLWPKVYTNDCYKDKYRCSIKLTAMLGKLPLKH